MPLAHVFGRPSAVLGARRLGFGRGEGLRDLAAAGGHLFFFFGAVWRREVVILNSSQLTVRINCEAH